MANSTLANNAGNVSQRFNSKSVLKNSVAAWFAVVLVGQVLFVAHIAYTYILPGLQGDMASWTEHLLVGYVAGDWLGNLLLALHLSLAMVVSLGGPLQIMPQIRNIAPRFHRWNGRIYITTALVLAPAAVYLKWSRELKDGIFVTTGITISAVLIFIFAVFALRTALQRNFKQHRKWALRLFIVALGTWFFRVGFMAWVMINQGPVGHTENFNGPFDQVWSFLHFMMPLALLEVYFWVQEKGGVLSRNLFSATMVVATLLTAFGLFGVFKFMWFD